MSRHSRRSFFHWQVRPDQESHLIAQQVRFGLEQDARIRHRITPVTPMSAADAYGANGMTGIDVRHFADEQDASDDEWDETEENARLSEPLCSRVQRCRAFPFCCVDRVPFVLASVLLISVWAMFCRFGSHLRRFSFSSM
jgi:hypothetical protein